MPTSRLKPALKPLMNRVLYWNCASGFFNKKPFIEKYIQTFRPVVFFVSECELTQSKMLEVMNIEGYEIHVAKTLETRNKGRTVAYVRKSQGLTRRPELESGVDEIIAFSLGKITIVGVYSGFKTYQGETMMSNFKRLLENLKIICEKQDRVLIIGDFNADPMKVCPKSRQLDIWQTECALEQHVTETTRLRSVGGVLQQSMIDLVFSKDTQNLTVSIEPTETSDHHLLMTDIPIQQKAASILFQKKTVIDWRKFSVTRMSAELTKSLAEIELSPRIETFERDLTTAILIAMNIVIPKRTVHKRREDDVISYKIEALKKKRDRLIKKARKDGCNEAMRRVKELDKAIGRVIKTERSRIINTKMKNSCPKTFWSTVNNLLGSAPDRGEIEIRDDEGIVLQQDAAAEMFSSFFKSKVDKLIAINPVKDESPCLMYKPMEDFTLEEIERALGSFKPKKSFGPDEIPLIVVKCCFRTLSRHVQHLFSLIVERGQIPVAWRMARIKPILKKGDSTKVINYRPISNLCSISKLFERCLLNRVVKMSTKADGINQHGFRSGHSTTTAAIEIQNCIADVLDRGKECLIYSVDLSAAFDLIKPGIFVNKAKTVIKDEGLVWMMHQFLTSRKAYVEVGNSVSPVINFSAGCPQGSTLGPKIFNIYCNDLNDIMQDHGLLVTYADDSYVIIEGEDIDDLKIKTTKALQVHLGWLKNNGMVCNVEKTEMMIMKSKSPLQLVVDGWTVTSRPDMKVLGLCFDTNLEWTRQVSNVVLKTNRMLFGLRTVRKYLTPKQAQQVITAFYFSSLYYGAEVWFHRHLAFHLKRKIRTAHYRALRLVYGKDNSRDSLDQLSQRASPDEWSNYVVAKLLARMVISGSPVRLCDDILANSYSERRQHGRLFFYDSSKRKIGRQCLRNRIHNITRQMKFEWTTVSISALRCHLKKCFFNYYRA